MPASRSVVALSLGLASCTTPGSQSSRPALEAQVDAYLEPYVAGKNFSGTVLLARGSVVLLEKGYGAADLERDVANGPETRFHIASVSKPFTAAAILQLADRGLLSVHDTLSTFRPNFPAGDRITIHHLLTHTSGIPDINRFPEYRALSQAPQRPEDLVAVIETRTPRGTPGDRYGYSNSNYNVLAYIVERVSGDRFGVYLEREIFGPLRMARAGHDRGGGLAIEGAAIGYIPSDVDGLARAPAFDWSVKTGNGSLYATARDLYRWARGLDEADILSGPARTAMFTSHMDDRIGYGWFLGEKFGRRVTYINGSSPGFNAYLGRYPDDDVIVVVVANNDVPLATSIGEDLAAMLFDESYDMPAPLRPVPVSPTALQGVAGTYRFPYGLDIDLSERDGRLYFRSVWPQYESLLIPVAHNEFFHRFYRDRLILEHGEDREVVSVYWGSSPATRAGRAK